MTIYQANITRTAFSRIETLSEISNILTIANKLGLSCAMLRSSCG
jgi:hypothetical protein